MKRYIVRKRKRECNLSMEGYKMGNNKQNFHVLEFGYKNYNFSLFVYGAVEREKCRVFVQIGGILLYLCPPSDSIECYKRTN